MSPFQRGMSACQLFSCVECKLYITAGSGSGSGRGGLNRFTDIVDFSIRCFRFRDSSRFLGGPTREETAKILTRVHLLLVKELIFPRVHFSDMVENFQSPNFQYTGAYTFLYI